MSEQPDEHLDGEEAFLCPFCGAPYRELIPADTVQVKCRYCGATVLVPPRLGGAVQRCPNHPESLAVGFCNNCKEAFCDKCLYIWGELYLCPKCLEKKKRFLFSRVLIISLPILMVILVDRNMLLIGSFFIFVICGIYYFGISSVLTVYEKMKRVEAEIPKKTEELYEELSKKYEYFHGGGSKKLLDRNIDSLMKTGLSREEAIQELSEREKFFYKDIIDKLDETLERILQKIKNYFKKSD